VAKLGDLLDTVVDHRGKTPKKLGVDFTETGVPVISAKLVSGGSVDFASARYVSEETWERWMPVRLKIGDVLLTSEAPLGRTAEIKSNAPVVLGQRLFALRGKQGVLDSRYLRYWLDSEVGQSELYGRATGTTVIGIKQSLLLGIEINVPNFDAQIAVSSVLGALDDKIAANSDAIKRALEIISVIASKIDTVTSVNSIARRNSNSLDPQKIDHQQVLHYSIPAFDSGYVDYEMSSNIRSSKFCISSPCVLVSKLNPRTPRVWSIPRLDTAHYSLASTEFVVLEPVGCSQGQLYAALSQRSLFSDLQCLASGTSNSHQRIKPSDLLDALVPDVRTLSSGDIALVDGLNQLMDQLDRENQTLAHTRDELLPLLMSGKIGVRDAEEAVAKVGVEKREGEGNVQ
jgi:type I restriction/modification system specificity determinant hsdS (S protein)